MKPRRAYNPTARWTWCTRCEGHGYHSRADVKAVRKRRPGESLSVFVCPHNPDLYHLGARPQAFAEGAITRDTLRASATRIGSRR